MFYEPKKNEHRFRYDPFESSVVRCPSAGRVEVVSQFPAGSDLAVCFGGLFAPAALRDPFGFASLPMTLH